MYESNSVFTFDLDDWIADQVLGLGPILARESRVDANATARLTNFLISSGKVPSSAEQFESCRLLFRGWCQAVGEESEWDDVVAFINWVEECDRYGSQTEDIEALRDGFGSWLDNEFDAALGNTQGGFKRS
ncbi:MAG TPA: hypothetical protein VFC29_08840 [Candidatus Limnocylindrales bacterium]|nr:hypothetical protein [Candidatus Limnocylindrales bacterium]